jgi:hypothetical protein
MSRKIFAIATVSLLLFVLGGVTIGVGFENEPEPLDKYPSICVCPDEITGVDVGETITISVFLCTDVENLYGFDIAFIWEPTIVKYVSHIVMAPVESYAQGVLHDPTFSLEDEVDPIAGTYWVACSSMSPAEPFNGNGVFFTITFEVLSLSNEHPFQVVSVALSDDEGQPILCQDPQKSTLEMPEQRWKPTGRGKIYDIAARAHVEWWIRVVKPACPPPVQFHHP